MLLHNHVHIRDIDQIRQPDPKLPEQLFNFTAAFRRRIAIANDRLELTKCSQTVDSIYVEPNVSPQQQQSPLRDFAEDSDSARERRSKTCWIAHRHQRVAAALEGTSRLARV